MTDAGAVLGLLGVGVLLGLLAAAGLRALRRPRPRHRRGHTLRDDLEDDDEWLNRS